MRSVSCMSPLSFAFVLGSFALWAAKSAAGIHLRGQGGERRAIVSLMWGRCDPGALATKGMLQRYGSRAEYIVYAGALPQGCREVLQAANITVMDMPDLQQSGRLDAMQLRKAAKYQSKFALFDLPGLTEPGTRIIALDTDAVPAQNIDEMFDFATPELPFWAAADVNPTFQMNSGVMVYRMYPNMFEEIRDTIHKVHDSLGDGDQDILSYHFQVVKNSHAFLPGRYNCLMANFLSNHRGRNTILDFDGVGTDGFAKVLHYTGGGFASRCTQAVGPKAWKEKGIAAALSVVARQCCAAQDLFVKVGPATAQMFGLDAADPLHCEKLRAQMREAGVAHE